jgi:hypothetical protein
MLIHIDHPKIGFRSRLFLLFCFFLLISLTWWYVSDDVDLPLAPQRRSLVGPSSEVISGTKAGDQSTSVTSDGGFSQSNIHAADIPSFFDVLKDPSKYIDLAKAGNSAATIALFSAVNNCFPLPSASLSDSNPIYFTTSVQSTPVEPECENFPRELGINRLELLRPSIQRNSAEAKFLYASSIKSVFYSDPFAMGQALNGVDQIQGLSERYAVEAAQSGLRDALPFLAMAYMNGSFGFRDVKKSYGYFLALHEIDGVAGDQNLMSDLKRQLSPAQLNEADALRRTLVAQCCGKRN